MLPYDLRISRDDPLRKTVYARVEGDPTVLALPDQIFEVLPKNKFAFRDRTVLALSPGAITRLTLKRDARTHELVAPEASANPDDGEDGRARRVVGRSRGDHATDHPPRI